MSTLSDDLATLSAEAYTYLYSLMTMEVTRRQLTAAGSANPGAGPANEIHHLRQFPPAEFRAVVRPNFDTLYSSAWIDLTAGPVLLEIPDSDDRYYLAPILDMWTDVFAAPGKRTTGTGPQRYVLTPPGYTGPLPDGATPLACPTHQAWLVGRTQTNGPDDYAAVNAFQNGWKMSTIGDATPVTAGPSPLDTMDLTAEPLRLVNGLSAVDYFTAAAQVLKLNPPHATDFSVLSRISRLGLVPGEDFSADRFSADEVAQIEQGAKSALADIAVLTTLGTPRNGWEIITDSIGVYGNDYLTRARITLIGLGANPADDAMYPVLVSDADGNPLTGDNAYTIHFAADALPPVDAFWSVTMYDAEGYQTANELDRFAIGDRDTLQYNDDGSLDLYLQHTNPGPDRVANWLPSQPGPIGVTLRLYAPKPSALDGTWSPPAVTRTAR
ncbi:DUF1254 domain-containing protein [Gordonia sp. CPCC 205515]|uniref:DUF1254 domain-containing protein n=1 Tax=Gordonia sp. CPCC 205515 TaxID=3140791 RepID=UPI003AF371BF